MGSLVTVWQPQPGPQQALVDCPLQEVLFGGSRGGGKTDGVLGKWAIRAMQYGSAFNARMFRRTQTSAEDAIERSKAIYTPFGATFTAHPSPTWRFPAPASGGEGARVGFRYLDSISDAEQQQGKNLTDIWIEEVGQYPDPAPIDRLYGAMRSAEGIPTQMILTGNPGGAGQGWIRERYRLYPLPRKPVIFDRETETGERVSVAVIPSRLHDNKILMRRDPQYEARLHLVGNAKLVQAWLDGDWSAVEGAFFQEWNEKLIIPPFEIPEIWTKFRSFDWGFARPFSVGWWTVARDESHPRIPVGALVRYREWYGCQPGRPNVGLRLTAEEVAAGIKEREHEHIDYSVADPACFAQDGGPSIAERMDLAFTAADNRRVGKLGAVGGWDQVRARMRDGALLVFDTNADFVRTIPAQQHDLKRQEDMDSEGEDHIADETRYACMSRPWRGIRKELLPSTELRPGHLPTLEQRLKEKRRGRRQVSR